MFSMNMKFLSILLAFMCGVVLTAFVGVYFFKKEISSQVAYTDALAIHQIIDGLEKDEIIDAPKTHEWLCHIAFRMAHDLQSVWSKTSNEFVYPAQEKLISYRKKSGLAAECEH